MICLQKRTEDMLYLTEVQIYTQVLIYEQCSITRKAFVCLK